MIYIAGAAVAEIFQAVSQVAFPAPLISAFRVDDWNKSPRKTPHIRSQNKSSAYSLPRITEFDLALSSYPVETSASYGAHVR